MMITAIPVLVAAMSGAFPSILDEARRRAKMKQESEVARRKLASTMSHIELIEAFVAVGAERDDFERSLRTERDRAQTASASTSRSDPALPEIHDLDALRAAQDGLLMDWVMARGELSVLLEDESRKMRGGQGVSIKKLQKILSLTKSFLRQDEDREKSFRAIASLLRETIKKVQLLVSRIAGMNEVLRVARLQPGLNLDHITTNAEGLDSLLTMLRSSHDEAARLRQQIRYDGDVQECNNKKNADLHRQLDATNTELHLLRRLTAGYLATFFSAGSP